MRKKKKTGPVGRVSVGRQTEMINLVSPGNLECFAVIETLATVSGDKVETYFSFFCVCVCLKT